MGSIFLIPYPSGFTNLFSSFSFQATSHLVAFRVWIGGGERGGEGRGERWRGVESGEWRGGGGG